MKENEEKKAIEVVKEDNHSSETKITNNDIKTLKMAT